MAFSSSRPTLPQRYAEFHQHFDEVKNALSLGSRKTSQPEADLALVRGAYQRQRRQIDWALIQEHWDLTGPVPELTDAEFSKVIFHLRGMRCVGDGYISSVVAATDDDPTMRQHYMDMFTMLLPLTAIAICGVVCPEEATDWAGLLKQVGHARVDMLKIMKEKCGCDIYTITTAKCPYRQ